MTATTPNPYGIQVVTSPGGLSDTAHIVNVIVVLMTCGMWIPVYILIALTAPKVNAQVLAPAGTPQDAINAAYNAAVAPTPEQRADRRRNMAVLGILAGAVALICGVGFVMSQLQR